MSRELPEGWTEAKLGELCRNDNDQVPVIPSTVYSLMGVRWYGNGTHLHAEMEGKKLATSSLNQVKAGQITYNKMWVSKSAFAVVPKEHDGLYATSEYPTFTIKSRTIISEYARYYMKIDEFREKAVQLCRGTTSRARLSPKDFLKLSIAIPPLLEQHRIVEILSSVDEAIASAKLFVEQARKVKKSTVESLLSNGIGHTQFKSTKIGSVPKSWKLKSIKDLCRLTNGNGFRPSDWTDRGLPIIRIQNLNGSRDFNYFSGNPKDKWIVEPGDLLFSWAGVRGVSFGPRLWDGPRGVLNQHIFKVHPHSEVNKFWLYFAMMLVTARIEAKAHGFKASLLHVHKSEITEQMVAVPPQAEQEEIVRHLDAMFETERLSMDYLIRLEAMRAALMPDLLTGRKRVFINKLAAE
ncbi:hypothetical protein HL658_03470 [Azospirillum sp. RWY-5-1]|uniref:Type I restriction modification DNA specificity domain-containing protein n=1 Tax=Azospirillum oleiclasticum TaxID=2735135 RepID=A0ABX2T637_9PROT|nr:restriction endonuclease subunit S [Azospirillum oleiclasticum]NYZ11596.1 hypothetical protein [Azospirillum oleiclasticum]NYZ18757.1 hypothetical protein [Azospirillum oleiclasticum]